MRRTVRWRVGLLAILIAIAGGRLAAAHDARPVEDEFVKGVFSPTFAPPPVGSYELPVIKRVPGFALRDSSGRTVNTATLMPGRFTVVSFIYTACSDRLGCPLASLALRDLQARLRRDGLGEQAGLISISFDPGRDTPAQLSKYARAYDADPAVWRFLTARSERELDRVLEGYGQDRARVYDEGGRFTGVYRHVLKVFLVDRQGNIRNVYSTGFLVPELVINDIKTLIAGQ